MNLKKTLNIYYFKEKWRNSLNNLINTFFTIYVFSLYNMIKKYQQYFLDLMLKEPEYIVTVLSPV